MRDSITRIGSGLRAIAVAAAVALMALLSANAALADGPGPLNGAMFGDHGQTLVVFLHGDVSGGGAASYHYPYAEKLAQPGVVVFAMLRPGYADSAGRKSPGSNNGRRDHYTRENDDLVAATIGNLKKATGARRVIAIGHSGGAAQIASIIGRYPGLINTAILASCPCDVPKWRRLNNVPAWPRSESPMDFAAKVPKSTTVIALVGQNDTNAWPELSQAYLAVLQSHGVSASFVKVPGASHDFRTNLAAATLATAAQQIGR